MRWTTMRKAAIIEAIQNGHLTPVEAKNQHGVSDEELAAWMRDYLANGRAGLRVTKLHQYQPRRSKLTASQATGDSKPPIADTPSTIS
jgi:transposase-like protein